MGGGSPEQVRRTRSGRFDAPTSPITSETSAAGGFAGVKGEHPVGKVPTSPTAPKSPAAGPASAAEGTAEAKAAEAEAAKAGEETRAQEERQKAEEAAEAEAARKAEEEQKAQEEQRKAQEAAEAEAARKAEEGKRAQEERRKAKEAAEAEAARQAEEEKRAQEEQRKAKEAAEAEAARQAEEGKRAQEEQRKAQEAAEAEAARQAEEGKRAQEEQRKAREEAEAEAARKEKRAQEEQEAEAARTAQEEEAARAREEQQKREEEECKAKEARVPRARVKATGRVGVMTAHDPEDDQLTYKLQFSDGADPPADWFARAAVELLGSSQAGAAPPAGAAFAPAQAKDAPAQLKEWATTARPAGTPVLDEGFICMGGRAPRCPKPVQKKLGEGPITLDTLQGLWTGSGGAQISVVGATVYLNSLLLKDHKIEVGEDGQVVSIGRLWQLDKWTPDGGIEFRASSTRDNMESARSEVWKRKGSSQQSMAEADRLKLMGYAGSAANPLERGVEGCLPGTLGAELAPDASRDAKDVSLLGVLLVQWRESGLSLVQPRQVVPDATNRSETGLGVELVHFVALSMMNKGFKKRRGDSGHDIPVVVREPPASDTHKEALELWKEKVAEDDGFPPVRADVQKEVFTSLGNGHFFQALNLFDCGKEAINQPGRFYTVGDDTLLAEAINQGVPSIVLKHETPRPVRAKIAALLNSKRDYKWTLGEDGTVDVSTAQEDNSYCSQFEWLSKGMDAHQVNCLVRTHLGIRDSKRIHG